MKICTSKNFLLYSSQLTYYLEYTTQYEVSRYIPHQCLTLKQFDLPEILNHTIVNINQVLQKSANSNFPLFIPRKEYKSRYMAFIHLP